MLNVIFQINSKTGLVMYLMYKAYIACGLLWFTSYEIAQADVNIIIKTPVNALFFSVIYLHAYLHVQMLHRCKILLKFSKRRWLIGVDINVFVSSFVLLSLRTCIRYISKMHIKCTFKYLLSNSSLRTVALREIRVDGPSLRISNRATIWLASQTATM